MDDEHTIALKNKVAELKERMSQMYAHSFADASKSKAFEAEFSLFLKSCEDARRERNRSITLQHCAVLSGLTVMIAASVSSIFVFSVHVLFGLLIVLGFGFMGCGFLFLLLVGEIRMQRAEDFCAVKGSAHRTDQLEFMSKKTLRDAWRTREEIERHLEAREMLSVPPLRVESH